MLTWRGVPLIPCDKLEMGGPPRRDDEHPARCGVGEAEQGVVGLHQAGIPGEIMPSLSARLMGIDSLGVATYLLTLYFSCAVLTDDALGVLENVEVGYYHDYEHRDGKKFEMEWGFRSQSVEKATTMNDITPELIARSPARLYNEIPGIEPRAEVGADRGWRQVAKDAARWPPVLPSPLAASLPRRPNCRRPRRWPIAPPSNRSPAAPTPAG